MALFKKEELRHGNIRKMIEVEVSNISVKCPMCNTFEDAYVDSDLDITEVKCDCDIDYYIEKYEHDEIVEARDDTIAGYEEDILELRKEVERLEQELMNAKR